MRRSILISWVLIGLGTVLIANQGQTTRVAGIVVWAGGVILQYRVGCMWLTRRSSLT